jgi:hypothetical protein
MIKVGEGEPPLKYAYLTKTGLARQVSGGGGRRSEGKRVVERHHGHLATEGAPAEMNHDHSLNPLS